jgi:hypothetical protein
MKQIEASRRRHQFPLPIATVGRLSSDFCRRSPGRPSLAALLRVPSSASLTLGLLLACKKFGKQEKHIRTQLAGGRQRTCYKIAQQTKLKSANQMKRRLGPRARRCPRPTSPASHACRCHRSIRCGAGIGSPWACREGRHPPWSLHEKRRRTSWGQHRSFSNDKTIFSLLLYCGGATMGFQYYVI